MSDCEVKGGNAEALLLAKAPPARQYSLIHPFYSALRRTRLAAPPNGLLHPRFSAGWDAVVVSGETLGRGWSAVLE